MDSMRSLNKSLPSSPTSRPTPPPEQLLQAFRSAALSVTNLYKTAAQDQNSARQTGYQDALDDLLTFLDKENLGLGDGEGWRVRQWATERLDGTSPAHANGSESEDERADAEKRRASPSPVRQEKHNPRSSSPLRPEDPPNPAPTLSAQQHTLLHPRSEAFTFRSAHQYPMDIDNNAPLETPPTPAPETDSIPAPASTPSVRVEVIPQPQPRPRNPNRHTSHSSRHNTRSSTSIRSLGAGAGSKRRVTFGDFFDIGNLDSSGGPPKRSRLN